MIEIETRNTRQSISSEHELNTVIIHAMSSCYVVMLCRHAMLCYVVMLCRRRTQSTSYNSGNSFDKLRLLKTLQVMSSGKGHQNTRQLVSFGKELQNTRQVDFRKKNSKNTRQVISSGKELPNTRQAMSSGKQLKTVDKLSSGPEVQHTHNKLEHCGRRSKQSTISHVFSTRTQSISYILRKEVK